MSDQIHAPFTPEQVKALNEYQVGGWFHPFTCGNCRDRDMANMQFDGDIHYVYKGPRDEHLLVAIQAGWICPTCDYTQDWAWAGMAMGRPQSLEWLRRPS